MGAGSAGSVIANRLSEVASWNILLLEAGKEEDLLFKIPAIVSLQTFTKNNWDYFTQPQANLYQGLKNKVMRWPAGKALGGTSVLNYMIYARGNRARYDKWSELGNPGWSYNEVLPYFIKSEKASIQYANYRFHGTKGDLHVEDPYYSPITEALIKGGIELGLPLIDYNANVYQIGVSTLQSTTKKGKRYSAASAFLEPVRSRPNLHILTSAYVTKVLINPFTKEAYGVEYVKNGKKYFALASKEVILSAGTLSSPKILMLSGVGDEQHLKNLGISPITDLKGVGQNLQDHLSFWGLTFTVNEDVTFHISKALSLGSILSYLKNGTGPISNLGGAEGIAYIKTHVSKEPEDIPDIELLFIGSSMATDYDISVRRSFNLDKKSYDSFLKPLEGKYTFTVVPVLLHPKSVGQMKLRSKNPYDPPLFYGNYLTDPDNQDLKTLLAAIRYIQTLTKTLALQVYKATLNSNPLAGCDRFAFDSEDYWICALRSISTTMHDQVGTSKMGPSTDPEAVVNNKLQVYGIKGLRVADCSVLPLTSGGHNNAIGIMIGEKAADFIKANWEHLHTHVL